MLMFFIANLSYYVIPVDEIRILMTRGVALQKRTKNFRVKLTLQLEIAF